MFNRVAIRALLLTITLAASAPGQNLRYVYSAKVVCGDPRALEGQGAVPQPYVTSINVHNWGDSITTLMKSLIVTIPPGFQRPVRPIRLALDTLRRGEALATDCADLRRRRQGLPAFFEGFVVIESPRPLNVVAVYSVPGGIDVVQIAERDRSPQR